MNKILKGSIFVLVTLFYVACSNTDLVDQNAVPKPVYPQAEPIGFTIAQRNVSRATPLEATGIYDFGVWACKYTDIPGEDLAANTLMGHYLVGYSSGSDANKVGYNYRYDGVNQSETFAPISNYFDNKSQWFYQGLGSAEYTGGAGWPKSTSIAVKEQQKLRFWDYATAATNFYAYSPYHPGATFSIAEGRGMISIPKTAFKAGYGSEENQPVEYIYAGTKVVNDVYNQNVALTFRHFGTRIRLAFYEDVPGYKVNLVDLKYGGTDGVQATPAIATGSGYIRGDYATDGVAIANFDANAQASVTIDHSTSTRTEANLKFDINPEELKESRAEADLVFLPNYYYAIPQKVNGGFTFHASFQLTAEDHGEEIRIYNAKVFVSDEYFDWQPNTQYTYVFKVTRGAAGSTDPYAPIDETDPDPYNPALRPIVFDGMEVAPWEAKDSDEESSI